MKKEKIVIYIHGKGGSAAEAEHYVPLFPDCRVVGFDYRAELPWDAVAEFSAYFDAVSAGYDTVYLVANSIGAFFSLCALAEKRIEQAFFISPIADMEKLIADMMLWAGVNEETLRAKKEIPTAFGETLSWEYLEWVRAHPVTWKIPTAILYGDRDHLQSRETVEAFAKAHSAGLTVAENCEHWFHTDGQMKLLDDWVRRERACD